MLAVTTRRPVRDTIKLIVRDSDMAGSSPTRNDKLPPDKRELVMIDPDLVTVVEGNSITAPNVLWVELRNVDVLDDHITCAASNAQSFAADNSGVTDTDDTLVATDVERRWACVVIGTFDPGAITRVLDGSLASTCPSLAGRRGCATTLPRCFTLSADEAPFAVDEDCSRSIVSYPLNQPASLALVRNQYWATYSSRLEGV